MLSPADRVNWRPDNDDIIISLSKKWSQQAFLFRIWQEQRFGGSREVFFSVWLQLGCVRSAAHIVREVLFTHVKGAIHFFFGMGLEPGNRYIWTSS